MKLWHRLQTKFLVLVLGSLVVFLGILSAVIVQRETNLRTTLADENQRFIARTIDSDLRIGMLKGTPRSTLDLIDSMRATPGIQRLEVLRPDGSPAFSTDRRPRSIPHLDDVIASGRELSFREGEDMPVRTILMPLRNEQNCVSCHPRDGAHLGVIIMTLSDKETHESIRRSTRGLALSLIALIAAIGVLMFIAIRRIVLLPLERLFQGAERIGGGDLSHRIAITTGDELQDLARAFNSMAGKVENSHTDLENRVRARTLELNSAMADVQDKAVRLYAYSRQMATLSRLSTRVFNAQLTIDDLLDRFMEGITRGLGYQQAMLCIVDRKRSWLEPRRVHGMEGFLPAEGISLDAPSPIGSAVRSGKVMTFSGPETVSLGTGPLPGSGRQDLHLVPLLQRARSVKCWQATSCIKTDCPAYDRSDVPCWLLENTLCNAPGRDAAPDKLSYCLACPVFPVNGILLVATGPEARSRRLKRISILRILAAEMSAALENHRLHEANQQIVRELLELHRVTATALTGLQATAALEVFTESALTFAGLDACSFWLADPGSGVLLRKAGGCVNDACMDRLFPGSVSAGSGILGQAFLRKNNYVISYDLASNDDTALGASPGAREMPSVLAIPLRSEDLPRGVFAVHKRGTTPFLETEIAAFMLLANQASLAVNVCLLNEELKGQNRELARHTGLLGGILSGMSSGIMLIDPATTVTLINEVGAEILHARKEELLGKRLSSILPETAVFADQVGAFQQTIDIQTGDGSSVPVGYSTTPYRGATGETEGVIVVFRDLSEIRMLQAELLSKERFAAMGKVVAGVAHEIRNPLFGISSIGQIFERELTNPAHQELVRALLSETKRMNQLVEELLIYGRPMKLNLAPCDILALWNEVLDMHQDAFERRGVRLRRDLFRGRIYASLDVHQIRQVFLNLLRNSLDATPEGGEITVQLLLEDHFIVFKVTDTGTGIPEVLREKIFDLFFTTKPKGTGLGLAICRKIVQDHGGDISVESGEKGGTTVTVRLPCREVGSEARQEALSRPNPGGGS